MLFNFIRGALLILLFLMMGRLLSSLLPMPFPASILGLLLLFFALTTGLVKQQWILLTGNFMIKYMALLFIPIGVGLINYLELLTDHWQVILFSLCFTTLFVMLSVGHIFQYFNAKKVD